MDSPLKDNTQIIDLTTEDSPISISRSRDFKQPLENTLEKRMWTAAERLTLQTLKDMYNNDFEDVVSVFNKFHHQSVPIVGLTGDELRTHFYASYDPKQRFEPDQLLKTVLSSTRTTFTSGEGLMCLLEQTALTLGIQLIRKDSPVQSAVPKTASRPSLHKMSRNELFPSAIDGVTDLSANTVNDGSHEVSSPPPKRRWSWLDPKTHQISGYGLKTPPSSKHIGRYSVSPRLRTPKTPTRSLAQQRPIVLIPPPIHTQALRLRTLSSSRTVKSETASIYAPSMLSLREDSDEASLHPTPPPSPGWNGERESFDSTSTTSSTEDEDYEESIQIFSTSPPREFAPKASLHRAEPADEAEIPLLGFRGYSAASQGLNSENGFRAGAFVHVGEDEVPKCPNANERYFRDEMLRHVGLDKSRPTPFISLTKNPLRAITRAFGAGKRSHRDPRVALINLHVLRDLGLLQVAAKLNLNPPGIRYDARGELLVWGSIGKEAIISVIDVQELLNHPPAYPADEDVFAFKTIKEAFLGYHVRNELYNKKLFLSFSTGTAVGQFLNMLKLPKKHHDIAVSVIVQDWAFKVKKTKRWQDHEDFCRGIHEGLQQGPPVLRQDIPKQTKSKNNAFTDDLIDVATATQPVKNKATLDATSAISNMTVEKHGTTPTKVSDIKPGASPDVMTINDKDQDRYSMVQQGEIFADLPAYYEAEIMELKDVYMPETTKVGYYEKLSGVPASFEIEILMDIEDSL